MKPLNAWVCKVAALALLGAGWVALAHAQGSAQGKAGGGGIEGRVERVIDGDSLVFVAAGSSTRTELRLKDIDAPEICQDGGREARRALEEMVLNQTLRMQAQGKDSHGRTLARLSTTDGTDINRRLVLDGHAWSLRSKWDQGPLVAQERTAIALRRGLHAAGGAEQPRVFRQRNGPCDGAAALPNQQPPTAAGPPRVRTAPR